MASPFWQYFHDKLNWPAIFRPGPVSALAKGLVKRAVTRIITPGHG